MRRVRPYQGPANSPSGEVGVLDDAANFPFTVQPPVRRPKRFLGGPFRPGSEWGPSSSPPSDDPQDVGEPGQGSLQVPRVPVRAGTFDPDRLRRHTETVEIILNSLLRRGRISRLDAADEFEIVAPGFAAARNPGPDDDTTRGATPGISWFNRSTGKLFYCKSAAEGAAEWTAIN